MVIMLGRKTLEDLVEIQLVLGRRLDVRPNEPNEVYIYEGIPIHYLVVESTPQFPVTDISSSIGNIYKVPYRYISQDGTSQLYEHWRLEIWDRVPEEFRDIVFYHELIEMDQIHQGIEYNLAHEFATEKTEEYIERHLSPEEKTRFEQVMSNLES